MTNNLVGDVFAKIIEEVISASRTDFEESGVSQSALQELQKEWQTKVSQRGVAQMPWDPKPQATPTPQPSMPSTVSNGLPSSSYQNYDTPPSTATNGGRIKTEPGIEQQYTGLTNGYPQATGPTQGGLARAQQLVQQQYGGTASASLNAMQRAGGGLALPGQQQQQQTKPQGLHLPGQSASPPQQQFSAQQHAAMMHQQQQQQQRQHQQQQLQQQQANTRIKTENESPQLGQGGFPQQFPPNYSQTDGADDAQTQWQALVTERRAVASEHQREADHMLRDQFVQYSSQLQSGLLVPLDEQPSLKRQKKKHRRKIPPINASTSSAPTIPQLDGELDEDEKPDIKEEDDENAINSDLDDSDDDAQGALGDDDDDFADQILCTYDKVQRVKNKWKCTLKDGVMSVNGKDWVFHKGTGEFEW